MYTFYTVSLTDASALNAWALSLFRQATQIDLIAGLKSFFIYGDYCRGMESLTPRQSY